MPARKRWTEEVVAHLVRVYQSTEDWGEIMAALPGFTKSAIMGRASILGLPKSVRVPSNVPPYDDHLFDQWDERSAYLLGYLEADGCFIRQREGQVSETLAVRFCTSSKDVGFLYQLQEMVGRSSHVSTGTCTLPTGLSHKYTTFQVTSRQWMRALSGCVRISRVPECITTELLPHYVRGYFDGDGSVYVQGRSLQVGFVFGNIGLAQDVLYRISEAVGSTPGMVVRQKSNSLNCWYFRIADQSVVARFGNWLYSDATYFLARKRDRFAAVIGG